MDIKAYFHDHPQSNEVFQTTDGYLFHKEQDARFHTGNLPEDKRGITHITRAEFEGGEKKNMTPPPPPVEEGRGQSGVGGEDNEFRGAEPPAEREAAKQNADKAKPGPGPKKQAKK